MRGSRRNLGFAGALVFVILSGLVGQALSAENVTAAAKLVAEVPGGSIIAPGTLSTALPLRNEGNAAAGKVAVLSISLLGSKLVAPSKLPVVSAIRPGSSSNVFATFKESGLQAGKSYVVGVGGTYATATGRAKFFVRFAGTVPPAAPKSARELRGTAVRSTTRLSDGRYWARTAPVLDGTAA